MNNETIREEFYKSFCYEAEGKRYIIDTGTGIEHADWWLSKLEQALAEYRGKIEGLKRKNGIMVDGKNDTYHYVNYSQAKGYNQALDEVLSLLSDTSEQG